MARKPRTDSTSEILRIAAGAERQIAPPPHVPMDDRDWPFWHNVVSEFARAEWTEHQLEIAAMLARTMADLEENQRKQREEGFVVTRANGTTVESPYCRVVKSLTGDVLALRRSLALHARAKSGSNDDAAKQRLANKRTEASVTSANRLLA